ncbi:hypothetical protein B0H11DRAFT_2346956 [Mycena galericulata]|nr:hypothetical protein B0H11DRAFT_2346956 [Mycena galericulata]
MLFPAGNQLGFIWVCSDTFKAYHSVFLSTSATPNQPPPPRTTGIFKNGTAPNSVFTLVYGPSPPPAGYLFVQESSEEVNPLVTLPTSNNPLPPTQKPTRSQHNKASIAVLRTIAVILFIFCLRFFPDLVVWRNLASHHAVSWRSGLRIPRLPRLFFVLEAENLIVVVGVRNKSETDLVRMLGLSLAQQTPSRHDNDVPAAVTPATPPSPTPGRLYTFTSITNFANLNTHRAQETFLATRDTYNVITPLAHIIKTAQGSKAVADVAENTPLD